MTAPPKGELIALPEAFNIHPTRFSYRKKAPPSGELSPQATERVQTGQKQCGKPQFVSVFHTGFFSPAVCGKLPGAKFQIGEKQTRKPE